MSLVKLLSEVPTGVRINNEMCELTIVKLKEQTPERKWAVVYQFMDSHMNPKPAWAVMGGNLIECLEKAVQFVRQNNKATN